jgi:hypothetical protein
VKTSNLTSRVKEMGLLEHIFKLYHKERGITFLQLQLKNLSTKKKEIKASNTA